MSKSVSIRTADAGDAAGIARIYNHYIEHTVITFEEAPVAAEDIAQRLEETLAANLPYIVATCEESILGYAYASKWKGRCAYRFSVETTVYLHPEELGNGIGSLLYRSLFAELESLGYHTAIGGISLPNPESIALHEKFGMQKVAHFKEVGFKFGNWVDVGYWQGSL